MKIRDWVISLIFFECGHLPKILSGEARVHSKGEHHGGKLDGRPRQEEQGLRGLHHKGADHHDVDNDANAKVVDRDDGADADADAKADE